MTFPEDNQPILTELKVGSLDWANISSDVRQTSPVVITRGRSEGATGAEPSNCSFTLNNRLGRYSPRNPNSELFGLIGRNTPVRVSIGRGAYGLVLADGSDGTAWTPDSVGTSITGDIDIRVDMEILTDSTRTWATGSWDVASKYDDSDTQRSWRVAVTGGQIRFTWWALGTVASQRSAISSTTIPAPATGRRAIKVTLDVNNGFGGADVEFWTAPTIAGPWVKLGSTQTSAGASSIFNGTAGTRIGAEAASPVTPAATMYEAEIRSGIDGTLVASPDFAAQTLDPVPFASASFTDAQGNTWTPTGSSDAARIWYGDVDVRFHGEVARHAAAVGPLRPRLVVAGPGRRDQAPDRAGQSTGELEPEDSSCCRRTRSPTGR